MDLVSFYYWLSIGATVALSLIFLLFLGTLIGLRIAKKKLRCVIFLHREGPMSERVMKLLGIDIKGPRVPGWAFYQCTDCGRPALRKLANAKSDLSESVDTEERIETPSGE